MTRFLVKILYDFDLTPPYADLNGSRFEISQEVSSTILTLVKVQFYLDIIIYGLVLWTIVLFLLSCILWTKKRKRND